MLQNQKKIGGTEEEARAARSDALLLAMTKQVKILLPRKLLSDPQSLRLASGS
jgi:hypothetical protein